MMIGAMFFGLILILCLAYFIFIKAWKQDVMALKIIGFVLVGLLLLTALCAPVCMMMGKCRKGGNDCCSGDNFNKRLTIRTNDGPGGPNMMYFGGKAMPGECPMMGDEKMNVTITTDEKTAVSSKPGEKVTTAFEMPIWQRAVDMMKGNDGNIKAFVDKVKTDADLLKKLKDALNK